MPAIALDAADAIELAETLQLITGWLTADPATLRQSPLSYIDHPAYGPDALRADLDRFAFLLGGNDGEHLLGPAITPAGGRSWHAACPAVLPSDPLRRAYGLCVNQAYLDDL